MWSFYKVNTPVKPTEKHLCYKCKDCKDTRNIECVWIILTTRWASLYPTHTNRVLKGMVLKVIAIGTGANKI